MHALWSGSISFGLINIPVKLYSATEDHPLNFDLLHKTDLSPIRYARICQADGKEIPYKDIVKGYEYQKGEYVVINEEDFKKADRKKTETIEIFQFAKETDIDSIYYEKPYFLEPGKAADKAYALLRETLLKSKKVAIVKFVIRHREHLGILKPYKNSVILNQLRFEENMRSLDIKLPSKNLINKKELDMSLKLVDQLTSAFHIEDYKDEYTDQLKSEIKDKLKGKKPAKKDKAPTVKSSKIQDITSLLEASLAKTSSKRSKMKKTV